MNSGCQKVGVSGMFPRPVTILQRRFLEESKKGIGIGLVMSGRLGPLGRKVALSNGMFSFRQKERQVSDGCLVMVGMSMSLHLER